MRIKRPIWKTALTLLALLGVGWSINVYFGIPKPWEQLTFLALGLANGFSPWALFEDGE